VRIIFQEVKKIIRPLPVVLCLIALLLLSINVPKNYIQSKQLLNTKEYPDKFTLYDNYSVNVLFHDFLLDKYGTIVLIDDLDSIVAKRTELLEQIDAAAQKDEVLLRTGTLFNRESAEFYTTIAPMEHNSQSLSEEDQRYVWSCINGQMRLDETDCPIGFLKELDTVIQTLKSGNPYQVLPADIFPIMRKCVSVIIGFVVASWLLVIPYGVAESRSGTQMLSFSTKQGRKSYANKMTAALMLSSIIIVIGAIISALLFAAIGADRYYKSDVISALHSVNLSIDGLDKLKLVEVYSLLLGMTAIVGLSSTILIANISLHFKHAVSAIACSLPVIFTFIAWYIAYTQVALDYGNTTISFHSGCILVTISIVITCVFSAGLILLKNKKNY